MEADTHIELLERHLIDYMVACFNKIMLRLIMSEKEKTFFFANGVQFLRWPANSTDLNSVVYPWEILARRVSRQACL